MYNRINFNYAVRRPKTCHQKKHLQFAFFANADALLLNLRGYSVHVPKASTEMLPHKSIPSAPRGVGELDPLLIDLLGVEDLDHLTDHFLVLQTEEDLNTA